MNKKFSKILLAAINARYSHTSFGLRWLYANLFELQSNTEILELEIKRPAPAIAEIVLNKDPDILGLGVYIWNANLVLDVIKIIKNKRPDCTIILGGPEVWFEDETSKFLNYADYIISGEGETAFYDLLKKLISNDAPKQKIIKAEKPDLETIVLPYNLYTDEDIKNRVIYVETSRGCPFSCEFCLSSVSGKVRKFMLEPFLTEMEKLINRGARHFKFVDRTFNLEKKRAFAVLNFFKGSWQNGMRLHFEIVPDLLDNEMLLAIKGFPRNGLHLEAGIQSLQPQVLTAISRKQDNEKALANLKFINEETGAMVHADLVAGLPFETLETFKSGFNRLYELKLHHIQVGVLKRLKGTPIIRHQESCGMIFSENTPYEIIKNNFISETDMTKIKRFARFFDIICNSQNFEKTLDFMLRDSQNVFDDLMALFEFIFNKMGRTHALDLALRAELLYEFMIEAGFDKSKTGKLISEDFYKIKGREAKLSFSRS